MRIHIGCETSFDFPRETPLIAMLNVHYSRASDLSSQKPVELRRADR